MEAKIKDIIKRNEQYCPEIETRIEPIGNVIFELRIKCTLKMFFEVALEIMKISNTMALLSPTIEKDKNGFYFVFYGIQFKENSESPEDVLRSQVESDFITRERE